MMTATMAAVADVGDEENALRAHCMRAIIGSTTFVRLSVK